MNRTVALLCGTGMVALALIPTVGAEDLAQEYSQARKIALKDPKVRAAYERANEILNKRIIQIDPALRPFVEAAEKRSSEASKKSAYALSSGTTHIVAQGETLTSISKRYKVSVESVTKANGIGKGVTLQVGRKLIIPSARRQ